MIEGSTIIFNDEYINVLTRHKENYENKLDDKLLMPDERAKLEQQLEFYTKKLDNALEFQDVIDEVINIDIPRITAVKTVTGAVLPLSNVQVVE